MLATDDRLTRTSLRPAGGILGMQRAVPCERTRGTMPHNTGLRALALVVLVVAALGQAVPPLTPAWATTLTFTAPAVATPNPLSAADGRTAIADTLMLSPSAVWNNALILTLEAQGFTPLNNWTYSGMPLALAADANYNVTTYTLALRNGVQFHEPVAFSLALGGTDGPLGATLHWLNLLNEDRRYATTENPAGFGFAIPGLPGFWQFDNGDLSATMTNGVAPFYDSNNGPNVFPPNFRDDPSVAQQVGSFLHFFTIPTWDVVEAGDHTLIIGDTGVSWGYAVVPEPASLVLLAIGLLILIFLRLLYRPRDWSGR
jgi:hypothetical protein